MINTQRKIRLAEAMWVEIGSKIANMRPTLGWDELLLEGILMLPLERNVTKRSLCVAGYVGQLIACITGAGDDVDFILGTVAGSNRVVRHLFCVLSQRPSDDSSEYDCAVFQVAVRCVWMLCRSTKAENFLKRIGVEKWFECLGEIVNLTIPSIDAPEWAVCFSKTLHVVARCALVLSEPEWRVFAKVARKNESLLNAFCILFCRKVVIQCTHVRNEAICRLVASLIHTLDAFEVIDSLMRDLSLPW